MYIILLSIAFVFAQKYLGPNNETPTKATVQTSEEIHKTKETMPLPDENFYVLENEYTQFVFSDIGGAVAEINLPLKSKEKSSIINPIEIDQYMAKKHPENDHFPLLPAYFPEQPGQKKEGSIGGYLPLLRRSTLSKDKDYIHRLSPSFYAFNLTDNDPKTSLQKYRLVSFDKKSITFELASSNRTIRKTFTLLDNPSVPYSLDMKITVGGSTQNLMITSGIPEVEIMSNSFIPEMKMRMEDSDKVSKVKLPKNTNIIPDTYVDWISNSNGFFGVILNPVNPTKPGYETSKVEGNIVPTRYHLMNAKKYTFKKYPGYSTSLPIGSKNHFYLISTPYQKEVLNSIDAALTDPTSGNNPQFIKVKSIHGIFSFISGPFAALMFMIMKLFHSVTHSWGISIILLTILLRIMLFPLTKWSLKSNQKMQELAPKVNRIKEKFKDDPKRAQLEQMMLYKEAGANPFMGCLPMLIQLPFLIGMFDLLKSTFELRGASFIPGWINNLTAPDTIFSWNMNLPIIGNQLHLLPILSGIFMFIQAQLTSKLPKDKSKWTDQQRQQRFSGNIMSVVFLFLFYNFPSGLNIYWIASTLVGIIQQKSLNKHVKTNPNIQRVK